MILEIVTTLLADGYSRDNALHIALNQTEAWATMLRTSSLQEQDCIYHVIPHPQGWVVRQLNGISPCLIFKTREEAIQFGKEMTQEDHAILIIPPNDGEIQQ